MTGRWEGLFSLDEPDTKGSVVLIRQVSKLIGLHRVEHLGLASPTRTVDRIGSFLS